MNFNTFRTKGRAIRPVGGHSFHHIGYTENPGFKKDLVA